MKFLLLLATLILSLAIEIERRKTRSPKATTPLPRPTQTYLQRFRQTKSYRRWIRFGQLVLGLSALGQAIVAFWGPFWPTPPKIEFHDTIDASSFVLPFRITNQSVLFSQNKILISCIIDLVDLVDGEGGFARFAGLAFVPPPISIGPTGVINYKCDAAEYIKVKNDGSIEIGFRNNTRIETRRVIFHKLPVSIASMCIRITGFYKIFGYRRYFASNTFQWPAGPGQNQWLEGPVAPDLPGEYKCPH
jgi:hypothetical protein